MSAVPHSFLQISTMLFTVISSVKACLLSCPVLGEQPEARQSKPSMVPILGQVCTNSREAKQGAR